jgi:mannosyl-oligosaccharide alpha-1,2-mannosidase
MRAEGSPSLLRAKPTSSRAYGASKTSRRRARRYVLLPILGCAAWAFLFVLYRQHEVLGERRAATPRGATLAERLATPSSDQERARVVHADPQAEERPKELETADEIASPAKNFAAAADDDDEGTPEELRAAAEALMDSMKWNLPDEPPAPPVTLTSGAGDFPRPAIDEKTNVVRTGAGGDDARDGAVPDGGWHRGIKADVERRDAVRDAMIDAYDAYEKYAFGDDELRPQAKRGKNAFGALGATIIDSLDTLWIMGLSDHYSRARNWVDEFLYFDREWEASVFETTIRVLGGLLAAYDLSGDEMYVEKCLELATRLEPAFRTPTGVPKNIVNLKTGEAKTPPWTGAPGVVVLSEFGSLAMEFGALSERVTPRDEKWRVLGETPVKVAIGKSDKKNLPRNVPNGLYPLYFDSTRAVWTNTKVSVGAMGDSWYEYLLKVWVQGGRTEAMRGWLDAWQNVARGILENLVIDGNDDDAFVASWDGGGPVHEMDHLSCFVGGMFCLGSGSGVTEQEKLYLETARKITKTCYKMYADSPTGIAPETIGFRGGTAHVGQRSNIQRPEAIESIFYMYRKTGDEMYREWAWEMFQSMKAQYRTESGWCGLKDVRVNPPQRDDLTQSFFFAETLKYFYLIFADGDVVHLDEWVFNTEAHPLRVRARKHSIV